MVEVIEKSVVSGIDMPIWSQGIEMLGMDVYQEPCDHRQADPRYTRLAVLHVCYAGEERFLIDGEQEWRIGPGEALLINPHRVRHLFAGPTLPLVSLWVRFFADQFSADDSPTQLLRGDFSGLRRLYEMMYRECRRGYIRPRLGSHLATVFAIQLRDFVQLTGRDSLVGLWQQVSSRLQEDWTLDSLAATAHMGREALRRRCREETGRSPFQQLRHLRIAAAGCLLDKGRSVAAVADEVGYSSAYTLSRAFQKAMGMPPGRWRSRSYQGTRRLAHDLAEGT